MLYQIEFSRQADRQFRNLPSQIQQRLKSRIDSLSTTPCPHGSEKLSGVDQLYRIRVGDYRIIYAVEDNRLIVLVVKIGHRREVYR
ncbi:MAG: type II toxin-antitoxin system RelE/ParE family toxin [Nitrospira sp.]|nr:type II toxin-antitoxin system RelE/ParE family toxin [Nitrospira sp.]MDH5195223.1 type II toxin-antitoxin system RelE/ParE family toxin [Nitrospira sp.]